MFAHANDFASLGSNKMYVATRVSSTATSMYLVDLTLVKG